MRRSAWRLLGTPVTNFALRSILEQVTPADPVFAEVKGNGFQYTAWPGADPEDIANHLLQLPLGQRGVHTVFGRPGVPVDLALDVDGVVPSFNRVGAPINSTSFEAKTNFINDVVNSAIDSIDRQADRLFGVAVERRNVLQSLKSLKISVHVHARFENGAAFADYGHLKRFVEEVRDGMVVPGATPEYEAAARSTVDMQIFRHHGTLRVYSGLNKLKQSPMILAKDETGNWQRGPLDGVSCMMMSWIIRPPLEVERELTMGGTVSGGGAAGSHDGSSASAGSSAAGGKCGDEQHAVRMFHIPTDPQAQLDLLSRIGACLKPSLAEGYRDWSTVGLVMELTAQRLVHRGLAADAVKAVYHASFHDFSRLCRHKYKPGDVDRKLRKIASRPSEAATDPRQSLVWLVRRCETYPDGLVGFTPPTPPPS